MSEIANIKGGRASGFTLFEVLIALGIFAIAVTGLVIAIDTTLQAALEARQSSLSRIMLESRLAYCLADPPSETTRVLEAKTNHGVRVEEILVPWPLKNGKNADVTGVKKLTITTKAGNRSDSAEVLLYRP